MAITRDKVAEQIEHFIRREFRVAPSDQSFTRDTHLYDSGFIDSTGVVELITFIESTFQINIPDEDLFSEDFTNINGISDVVHRRSDDGVPEQGQPEG